MREPAADHALAYATLESGVSDATSSLISISNWQAVVVGLATSDSELYATFPGTVGEVPFLTPHVIQMSALDACGLANFLTRMLRKEVDTLFQC
jgi:hypothetical protein